MTSTVRCWQKPTFNSALSLVSKNFTRTPVSAHTGDSEHLYQLIPDDENAEGVRLNFRVTPESIPPTNIHVLIGRNGVGKTYLLNRMTRALVNPDDDAEHDGFFTSTDTFLFGHKIVLLTITKLVEKVEEKTLVLSISPVSLGTSGECNHRQPCR